MSISEMMLDGTLCEGCGCTLAGPAPSYPRYCHDCRRHRAPAVPTSTKVACPLCAKRVKRNGLDNHMRDAHGVKNDNNG